MTKRINALLDRLNDNPKGHIFAIEEMSVNYVLMQVSKDNPNTYERTIFYMSEKDIDNRLSDLVAFYEVIKND